MALPIIGAGNTPFAGTIKTAAGAVGAATSGSDIERRLAALENAFRVATDGHVTIACKYLTIKAASSVAIDSASMTFKGAQNVSFYAGQFNLKGSTINVESSSLMKLKGFSTVDIESPGNVVLKGATIRLN